MNEIKLGDVTVTRVEETHGPIMPARDFFPTVAGDTWQRHHDELVPDHLGAGDDMVHTAMQSWVLRSGGRTIVCTRPVRCSCGTASTPSTPA